ncbi:hypothetical protein SDC9_63577 [bioreactor metagenome]|uniref:Uncharacterized protein n=1 Tax=bioreactor metagenome TaxID=1076179 RepID=A0A644XM59_9ZZZZ
MNRQSSDEFGDESELDQVIRHQPAVESMQILLGGIHDGRPKAHGVAGDAFLNHLVQTNERSATDEQNVAGVDLEHLLVGMLPPSLGRYGCIGTLDDLQQSLLYTLTADVAGDGGVFPLLGDLVDLIDEDDAVLCSLYVVIGVLNQFEQDILHILTHISSLGKGGGIGDGKGNLQLLCQGGGKQRLSGSGRSDHENVGLIQFHTLFRNLFLELHPLVVVVHCHGKDTFCVILANDIFIHVLLQLLWSRNAVGKPNNLFLEGWIAGKHIIADLDALITDGNTRSVDQPLHFFLAFAAERTDFRVSCHQLLLLITASTIP